MTISGRRALKIKWEAGEPRVRYRMPVALARERVARAERRKSMWWLNHPSELARFLSVIATDSVRVIEDGLACIADGLNEIAAWMHGEAS